MMEHPINDLFQISMKSLEQMIDVNTVIGDIKVINDDISVIPISKVKCTYVTGGIEKFNERKQEYSDLPFGGATGGQLTISPVAFLVINKNEINILHLEEGTHLVEKIIDTGINVIEEIRKMIMKKDNPEIK